MEANVSYDRPIAVLDYVEKSGPDGIECKTDYDYVYSLEADQTPQYLQPIRATGSLNPKAYWKELPASHIDIESISQIVPDGADDVEEYEYAFEYVFNDHMESYEINDSPYSPFIGYYQSIGLPSQVSAVTLPNGSEATFTSYGQVKAGFAHGAGVETFVDGYLVPNVTIVGDRETVVIDTEGNERTYRFKNYDYIKLYEYFTAIPNYRNLRTPPTILFYELMEIVHPGNLVEKVVYDSEVGSMPIEVYDVYGNKTTFEYGEPIEANTTVLGVNGQNNTFSAYSPDPTKQINALDDEQVFAYDVDLDGVALHAPADSYHLMTTFIDEENRITYTPVDALGRRETQEIYQPDGSGGHELVQRTQYEYGQDFGGIVKYKGVVTRETLESLPGDPDWAEDLVTEYTLYDEGEANGFPGKIKEMTVDPGGLNLKTVYTYDANGNRTSMTSPRAFDTADPLYGGNFTTYYVYDARNRLTDIVYPPASSATDMGAPRTTYVYDWRGKQVGVIDEEGGVTVKHYDALGRQIKEIVVMGPASGFDTSDPQTFLSYTPDQDGVMPDDIVTSMTYNNLNAKLTETDPNGNVTEFFYDDLNRVIATRKSTVREVDYTNAQDRNVQPITWFYYGENSGSGSIFKGESFKPTHTIDMRGYLTVAEYDELYRSTAVAQQYDHPVNITSLDPHVFPLTPPSIGSLAAADYAVTTYTYDDVGNPLTVTDDLGKTTTTQYDALNRPVKVIFQDTSEAETRYTSTGLKYENEDELDRLTTTEYDAAGRAVAVLQPTVFDAAAGQDDTPETTQAYDANGNMIAMTNPLEATWNYEYDVRDRRIKEILPAVDYINEAGGWSDDNPVRPEIETTYDNVGNVIAVTDPRDKTTHTRYDPAKRPIFVISPLVALADSSSLRPVAITEYDLNGNILYQKTGSLSAGADPAEDTPSEVRTEVTNTWDALNRLTATEDANAIVVQNTYDLAGNLTSVTDGEEQVTKFEYDGLNRNTVTEYADGEQKVVAFNGVNQVTRTDENGVVTRYGYDDRHRLETVDYEDDSSVDRSYTYDLVGNILGVEESGDHGDLRKVKYVYDGLNRIGGEKSAGLWHVYRYDLAGNRLFAGYGAALSSDPATVEAAYQVSSSEFDTQLRSTYDALNRTATIYEDTDGDGTYTTGERESGYRYDLAGNIRQKLQANGHIVLKTYDALGRASVITGPNGTDTQPLYRYANFYDIYGNLKRIEETYPSAAAKIDDRTVTNTYDASNRLEVESITQGSDTITTTYAYDDANNRVLREVTTNETVDERKRYVYENDLNQLTYWYEDWDDDGAWDEDTEVKVGFTYDDNGNRVTSTRVDGSSTTTVTYGYDWENRLLSLAEEKLVSNQVNLHAGTLATGEPTAVVTYHFVENQAYAYAYDYRTRRVLRDESGADGDLTYIVFSGGTSAQEYTEAGSVPGLDGADTLAVQYVRGSDYGGGVGGILYTLRSGSASFKHYNSRGDVVAATDGSGSLTYQAAYEAYGKHGDTSSSQEWGDTSDRQQANTKDEDPTGLLNEGFRYRDLETGTFITRDPLGFVDGPNVYTYVNQNPWTKFDPQGLEKKKDKKKPEQEADGSSSTQDVKTDSVDAGTNQSPSDSTDATSEKVGKFNAATSEATKANDSSESARSEAEPWINEVQLFGGITGTIGKFMYAHGETNLGVSVPTYSDGILNTILDTKLFFHAQGALMGGVGPAAELGGQFGGGLSFDDVESGLSTFNTIHCEGQGGVGSTFGMAVDVDIENTAFSGGKGRVEVGASAYGAAGAAKNVMVVTPSLREISDASIKAQTQIPLMLPLWNLFGGDE